MTEDEALLRDWYGRHSKHSDYQALYPPLAARLSQPFGTQPKRLEAERLACMAVHIPLNGARVMEIGANTGYFTLGCLKQGAREVLAYELNPEHARFVTLAARVLGWAHRLSVRCEAYSPLGEEAGADPAALCLNLNVLHHLGDDFGAHCPDTASAKASMLDTLRQTAPSCRRMFFQMGFNWKGDRHQPLFAGGTKAEMVEFVAGAGDCWRIEAVWAYDPHPAERAYRPLSGALWQRQDAIGEFANRPLFLLERIGV